MGSKGAGLEEDGTAVGRDASFDALRGLAILGVVLVHTGLPETAGPEWLRTLVATGARGVQLFFVVSAMTLMAAWTRQAGPIGWRRLGAFFLRRFARLAPMFYLGVGISLLSLGMGARYWAPAGIGVGDVLLTLGFVHGWHPVSFNSVVPGGWSIASEATFYAVFPLIATFATDLRRAVALFLIAGLLKDAAAAHLLARLLVNAPGMQEVNAAFAWLWFPTQLPVFLVGVVTHHVLHASGPPGWRVGALCLCGAVALALRWEFALWGVGFGLLVVAIRLAPVFLSLPVRYLAELGRVSFSIYIVHFYVIDAFRSVVRVDGLAAYVGVLGGVLLVSWLAASLCWRLVEAPGIRIGRRLSHACEGCSSR